MIGPALVLDSTLKSRIPFRTRSGRNALRWIRNRALSFSEILLDGEVWDEDVTALLVDAVTHRPVTPVRVISSANAPGFRQRLEALGISVLSSAVVPPRAQGQDAQPGFASSLSLLDDGEYLGVPTVDFLGVSSCPWDVYFKSPLGKWVLLVRSGDSSLAERVGSYWQKGLQHLYIRRQSHQDRIAGIRLFGEALRHDPEMPPKLRLAQVVRGISRRLESLQSLEQVEQETWSATSRDLAALHGLWPQGPWNDPAEVLARAALLDHSTSVMVLALMVGRALGFDSQALVVRLGLAAAFHDIGLLGMPLKPGQVFDERDPSRWTPEMRAFFDAHPSRGANWVLQHLRADGIVGQAIALHHWRRNQKDAFGLGDGVPRVVEIIAIAEELDAEIRQESFSFEPGWIAGFRSRVADQFSAPVLESLEKSLGRLPQSGAASEIELDFSGSR